MAEQPEVAPRTRAALADFDAEEGREDWSMFALGHMATDVVHKMREERVLARLVAALRVVHAAKEVLALYENDDDSAVETYVLRRYRELGGAVDAYDALGQPEGEGQGGQDAT